MLDVVKPLAALDPAGFGLYDREKLDRAERAVKAIQEKLDRLDERFLFERSIDIEP